MNAFALSVPFGLGYTPGSVPVAKMHVKYRQGAPPEFGVVQHATYGGFHIEAGQVSRHWSRVGCWSRIHLVTDSPRESMRLLTGMVKVFRVFTLLYKSSLSFHFMRPSILIVEDDPITRELLRFTLETAGFETIMAESGARMWKQLERQPDVVILDLCLPDADGLELLRQLRRTSDVPVLIHSTRSDDIERILGIEIGADDFLPKPCNLRELLARVRALLRRSRRQPAASPQSPERWLYFDGWKLNCGARTLRNPTGQSVELNGAACAILMMFLEHPLVPLSREQLSRALRREYLPFDRTVDVHVSQLRKLLGIPKSGGEFIKTLRSQGYLFSVPVEVGGLD
jgi:DNA-binding response OmpR family regulator